MKTLMGKVAIVTGASSGIGRATARLFASEGASVVVAARRTRELNALVSEIHEAGGKATALAGDVQDEEYARALVEVARQQFGGLDVAFNNAGTLGETGAVTDLSVAGWNHTLATNLTSAYLGAKYQIPEMLRRGSGALIFTSTFVGYTAGFPGLAAYAASKAGVIGLMKVLACEYSARRIRVNALLPGGVDTPMGAAVASSPETRAYIEGLHAMKRVAAPEEIANAALFLAADASSFVTGSAMLVDGGVSINRT